MISKDKVIDYIIVITLATLVGGASIIYHNSQTECIKSSWLGNGNKNNTKS